MYKMNGKLCGDNINSLRCIFIQLVKKCFLKICETSKCHNFHFSTDIHQVFNVMYEKKKIFLLKFKLNQFRISPLTSAQKRQIE